MTHQDVNEQGNRRQIWRGLRAHPLWMEQAKVSMALSGSLCLEESEHSPAYAHAMPAPLLSGHRPQEVQGFDQGPASAIDHRSSRSRKQGLAITRCVEHVLERSS